MTTASDTITAPDAEPSLVDLVETPPAPAVDEPAAADPPAEEPAEPAQDAEPDADTWVHKGEWNYDWLDYHGDRLAVRIPNANGCNSIVYARSCSIEFQLTLINKFIASHVSTESRERVLSRMADPDDDAFDDDGGSIDDLLKTLTEIAADRITKEAEALAATRK